MENFIENLTSVNDSINTVVWTKIGVWLLIAVGVIMTTLTGFFQVTHIGHWMKKTVGSIFDSKVKGHTGEKASISQFQALCTALAATVGVGNIAGVAAAIMSGGPGAVFWMWIAAFFGMMTNFSENVLGIYFRRKNKDGERIEQTDWHTVVCWRGLADIAEKLLRKGTQVYIEGKLQNRSWEDRDGNKHYATEVVAENFTVLGNRARNDEQQPTTDPYANILNADTEPIDGLPF